MKVLYSAKSAPDQVKVAYKDLARRWHPDVKSDPLAHERMIKINEAMEAYKKQAKPVIAKARAGRGK